MSNQDAMRHALEGVRSLFDGPDRLDDSCLDAVAAKTYANAIQNVDGSPVYDLQTILAVLKPDEGLGAPDGAFGNNTRRVLEATTGHSIFERRRDIGTLAALLGGVLQAYFKDRSDEGAGDVAETLAAYLLDPCPPFFCQADERWAEVILGANRTFRKSGCAACALSMLLAWVARVQKIQHEVLPTGVDRFFDENGGYYKKPDGTLTDEIVWTAACKYSEQVLGIPLKWDRIGGQNSGVSHDELVSVARDWIAVQRWPIVMRVQYLNPAKQYGNWFNHFVLGVGVTEQGAIRFLDSGYRAGGSLAGIFTTSPPPDAPHVLHKGGYRVVSLERYRQA